MREHVLNVGGGYIWVLEDIFRLLENILGAGGRGTETPVLLLDTLSTLYAWRY